MRACAKSNFEAPAFLVEESAGPRKHLPPNGSIFEDRPLSVAAFRRQVPIVGTIRGALVAHAILSAPESTAHVAITVADALVLAVVVMPARPSNCEMLRVASIQ